VTRWVIAKYTGRYQPEIVQLAPRNDIRTICGGDYVEKQWNGSTAISELSLLEATTIQTVCIINILSDLYVCTVHPQY
jgi:hypothetical protein